MLLTAEQVAEKLGIGVQMVRDLCRAGRIPAINVKGEGATKNVWRVDDKALKELIHAQRNGNGNAAQTLPPPSIKHAEAPKGYVGIHEAARITGWNEQTLYGRVKQGKIESIKADGTRWFLASALKHRTQEETEKKASAPASTTASSAAFIQVPAPQPAPLMLGRILVLLENILQRVEQIPGENILQRITALEGEVAALRKVWS